MSCSLAVLLARQVSCDGVLANVPGGQTAAAALASASDGMSRYLAPDGPIQPALTAIGGLPVRGAELANKGITSISSGFNRGAQSLSRSAGQGGQIRMPGLQTLESSMPASFAQLGQTLQGAIRSKNNFIRGQAEAGVAAGERLRNMMQQGLQVRSSGGGMGGKHMAMSSAMSSMGDMMGHTQEAMMKGGQELKSQLQKSLSGHMDRMQSMQGMGSQVSQQVRGYGQTLTEGLQGAHEKIQQTGEKLINQIQSNHGQNRQAMSGLLGSMQGSMQGSMGNMQKNFEGLTRHAQNAAQQVSSHLQQAVQGPLNMIQSLGSNLGSMMKGGMSSGGSQGGRY